MFDGIYISFQLHVACSFQIEYVKLNWKNIYTDDSLRYNYKSSQKYRYTVPEGKSLFIEINGDHAKNEIFGKLVIRSYNINEQSSTSF